ncbi:RNA polymerase sigma-70 factor (ECF subfamily) [Crossiella equi]|uniref:RNA polymerase sigma-70 factor (ECF subfamily) n=1 Tax=Crossiella equi TaxID=130796 RepID=A0ABS5ANG6_9PSEU|nr:sigma-70 family RNA polymerase sigma factor [Crossiella equi]MBP2478118.1 RNA polymerase sigma-70 factor (ECF subfamily) [Crossiella equi]
MDFPEFFERSCPAMLARALMLTENRQDAEDAVQEAFAEAMRRWPELAGRHPETPEEWVARAVRQRLWAAARRWRRYRPLDLVVSLPARSTPEQAAEVRLVLDALARLPARWRVVAHLHLVEGLTAAEVAAELRIREGAARTVIGKARKALDNLLGLTGARGEGALAGRPRPITLPGGLAAADPVAQALRRTERLLEAGTEEEGAAPTRVRDRLP